MRFELQGGCILDYIKKLITFWEYHKGIVEAMNKICFSENINCLLGNIKD